MFQIQISLYPVASVLSLEFAELIFGALARPLGRALFCFAPLNI